MWLTVISEPVRAQRGRPGAVAGKPTTTPWSQGVSDSAQQRALQLFRDGNGFLEQLKYTEAVTQYELALAVWDHPNIRFNMAICLINMRQPLAAWTHLQAALRFGDAPLGKRLYAEALTYVAMLESSLAQLTVTSTEPGTRVLVDGVQVLNHPGEHTMKLVAGKHQLVATRPGHVTDSRVLDLRAGAPVSERIALVPETVRRINYERRWPWWVPWSVAGAGVALGGAGAGIYVAAHYQMKHYDRSLAALCPMGCADSAIPADLQARASNARHNSGIAIGFWCGAGALAITGAVMAVMNRPSKHEERVAVPTLTVSRHYVGGGLSFTWY